ncbi:MAG TPA: hypothetical protein VKG84_12440 [Candidatus Acidoferrales bacterium]|nr:hypothetical protein [Candidatus Acidoferrales bacterium]
MLPEPAHAAGPEVAGSYRVEQVANLGTQVRVTLHVRLLNNSKEEVFIRQAALESRDLKQKPAANAILARLQPRESTTVEQEVVVARTEYERWRKGERPTLRVALQPPGGGEVTRTISLRRLPARRAQ